MRATSRTRERSRAVIANLGGSAAGGIRIGHARSLIDCVVEVSRDVCKFLMVSRSIL
jgi:hypothetical protein